MERVRRVVYFHYIHLIKSGSFIKENSRNRKDKTGTSVSVFFICDFSFLEILSYL